MVNFIFSLLTPAPFHGFAFWFDVEFNGTKPYPANDQTQQSHEGSSVSKKRLKSDELVVLSTAPEDAPTHWQQVV